MCILCYAPLISVSVIGALVLVKFYFSYYDFILFFTKKTILDIIRNALVTDVM